MSTARTIVIGLAFLTLLRLVLAAVTELSPDEAYYFLWSENLAPSYYSKGPGIAIAMKLSSSLFGDSAFGIRMLSPLLGFATSILLFRLGRGLFDEQTGAWAVVLLNLTPIFNAGSVLLTIDPLSIFFWVAALLTFWRALHRASSLNLYWPATGLLIGLGFLCKYTNALQLLSIVLLLVLFRRWRGQLRRPGLYLLLLCFLLCTIPVLVWNHQHAWITVTHLVERGNLDESSGFNPLEFLEFAGMHLGTYSPILFVGLVWALWRALRRYGRDDSETYLLFFSLPIISLYFLLSFKETGEGNWTAPGFITVGLLLVHYWRHLDIGARLKSNLRSAALTVAALMSCLVLNTEIVRQAGIPWPYERDPSTRMRGWRASAAYLDEVLRSTRESLGEDVFVIANRYQSASILSFYLDDSTPLLQPGPDFPKIHIPESQLIQNQYSFWPRYDGLSAIPAGDDPPRSPFLGRHAIFITDDSRRGNLPRRVRNAFERAEVTGVVDIVRFNHLVRRLKVFTCYDYRGLPL
ncbi:MAG: ArnT family glycosyltransferase [Verrucomicrobiales bacterium]